MSDLNVALRLSLVNQMKSGADAAKRDLQRLKSEAEKLGKTQAGFSPAALRSARQLEMIEAKKAITVERTTAAYRRQRAEMIAGDVAARRIDRAREVRTTRDAARMRREMRSTHTAMAAGLASRGIQWSPDGRMFRSSEALRRQRNEVLAATLAAQRATARGLPVAAGVVPAGSASVAAAGAAGGVAASGKVAGLSYARAFIGGLGAGIGAAAVGQFVKESIFASADDEFERDQLRVLGNISEKQMEAYRKSLDKTARLRGIGSRGSLGIFGGLMAGGLSSGDAAAMTDNVAIFSKATRSSVEDASAATIALRNNMQIKTAKEIMAAYDAINTGGKAGEFEVADMARHLPSGLAKMSGLGETGISGVRNAVAMLQAIRKGTGTSAEAMTQFEALLSEYTSPTFIKNAGRIGINIEKTMKDAEKNGLSPVFAVLHEIEKKTKGDKFRLGKLMPNTTSAAALRSMLRDMPFVLNLLEEMERSSGSTMEDYATATDNAKESFRRFSSTIIEKSKALAEGALPSITNAMDAMTNAMNGGKTEAGSFLAELQRLNAGAEQLMKGLRGEAPGQTDILSPVARWFNEIAGKTNQGLFGRAPGQTDILSPLIFGKSDRTRWDEYMLGRGARPQPGRRMTLSPREAEDASMKELRRLQNSGDLEAIMEEEKQKRLDAAAAAKAAMDGYKRALASGLDDARTTIATAVAEFKAMLSFTAGPTISPSVVPVGAGAAPATQHAGGGGLSVTQNISTSNPRMAARRAQREQNRAVNLALANALHDTGRA